MLLTPWALDAPPTSSGFFSGSPAAPSINIAPMAPQPFAPDVSGGWIYQPNIVPIAPGLFPPSVPAQKPPSPCGGKCGGSGATTPGPTIGPGVPAGPGVYTPDVYKLAQDGMMAASLAAEGTADTDKPGFPILVVLMGAGLFFLWWLEQEEKKKH